MRNQERCNVVGRRFGRRVVTAFEGYVARGRKQVSLWRVLCDCGSEAVVKRQSLNDSASCGCHQRDVARALQTRHGHTSRKDGETSTYRVWKGIITRCCNPNHHKYPSYGGRGITVCIEWKSDYAAFLKDMGQRPEGMSIDRVDNSKGYSPENCRWADRKEQARNTRRNRWLTIDGETKHLAEWSRLYGVSGHAIAYRIRAGWSPSDAVRIKADPTNRLGTPARSIPVVADNDSGSEGRVQAPANENASSGLRKAKETV